MPGAALPPILVAGASRLHAAVVAAALTSHGLPARSISPQGATRHGQARAVIVLADVADSDLDALIGSAGSAPCLLIGADARTSSPPGPCIRLGSDIGLDEIVTLLCEPTGTPGPRTHKPVGAGHPRKRLSPRELDVLRCLADGASNDEIGRRLKMSPHTARTHVANILTKLGTTTRVAAVGIGRRERLL